MASFGQKRAGWLGVARSLSPLGEVIAPGRQEGGDLACLDSLRETILRVKPSVIVNAAAYTAVDKAEIEKELAFLVNAKAPEVLAEEADNIHALLVHYSTDYVFDGSSDHPRRETETPRRLMCMEKVSLPVKRQCVVLPGILSLEPVGSMPLAATTLQKPCCASLKRKMNSR